MVAAARENLGPAERIINTLLTYQDHLYHGRPGMTTLAPTTEVGVTWAPVTYKLEDDKKVVYRLEMRGKKEIRTKVGFLLNTEEVKAKLVPQAAALIEDGTQWVVDEHGNRIGGYRQPGIFPEVAAWFYKQIAEVYKLDNEFVAKWASYAFAQEHKDLKVILAAFLLVQSRKGDPVVDGGKVAFHDADYRDVGEAMMLLMRKDRKHFAPKMLLRVHDVLTLPEVVKINHELGFGNSARKPFLGRWPKVVEKWLQHREENPKMFDGLVKEGWRTTVMELARRVGYRPVTPAFFSTLRWKQAQAKDGRRQLLIGAAVAAAETWTGKNEREICEVIVKTRPDWKRIVGMLPASVGVTRAIVAAAVSSGGMSQKDLIIATPTLEELGMLDVPEVRKKWETAMKHATDMRAANIARNVRSEEVAEQLVAASDKALQKEVEKATRMMRIYFMVDISGSMEGAIELAKEYIAKFLQGFPPDRVHIATFNTAGREIKIPHASAAGVTNAFKGIAASGGTDYGEGVRTLSKYKPAADEDVVFIFVGDEEAPTFDQAVRVSGLNPCAFGLLKVIPNQGAAGWRHRQYGGTNNVAVRETAQKLGIPCFIIEPETFSDPYAIPRTIRTMMLATPITQRAPTAAPRVTLIDLILQTELLAKPEWA